jgi:hypothetical protein
MGTECLEHRTQNQKVLHGFKPCVGKFLSVRDSSPVYLQKAGGLFEGALYQIRVRSSTNIDKHNKQTNKKIRVAKSNKQLINLLNMYKQQ